MWKIICDIDLEEKNKKKKKNLFVDANEWELYTNVNFGSQKNALKQKNKTFMSLQIINNRQGDK